MGLIYGKSEVPNYKSLPEYIKFLKTELPQPVNKIYPGRFYCYNYKFAMDNIPYSKLKFYDYMPLIYCFEVKQFGWVGINFHHMPVDARNFWLNKLIKLSEKVEEQIRYVDVENKRLYKIPNFNYPKCYMILKKSKIAIRQYLTKRAKNLRPVPLWLIRDVMQFYARTYYGVGINQIDARYRAYRPK